MTSQQCFLAKLKSRLEEAQVPYMITGSTASVVYGEPRATKDVDVVNDPSSARKGPSAMRSSSHESTPASGQPGPSGGVVSS